MNRLTVSTMSFLITMLALGCASSADAQIRAFLGERVVSDRAEYDTIWVTDERGPFHAIQLRALKAPVEVKRLTVYFENGSKQRFERNVLLRPGDFSPRIDLAGGNRYIRKVVFYYETRSPGHERALVRLFGIR